MLGTTQIKRCKRTSNRFYKLPLRDAEKSPMILLVLGAIAIFIVTES